MKILILSLLIITSYSLTKKNCELIGKWKSTEFTSDKAVDTNKDGIYNQNLLKEDECSEVILNFLSNGKVERHSKNKRTNCNLQKSTMGYTIDGDQIIFNVSGMEQKLRYKIIDCKLHIYGVYGYGQTENGKQSISINSAYEKK